MKNKKKKKFGQSEENDFGKSTSKPTSTEKDLLDQISKEKNKVK